MNSLRLPIWVVTDRTVEVPSVGELCDIPKSVHAFLSTEQLADFLNGRVAESWKVSLVAHREAFILAIAHAHQHGSTVICFGPTCDGVGGEALKLVDLLALVRSLADKDQLIRK
jgi:hypothetical protein